jgi:hypothetical protein
LCTEQKPWLDLQGQSAGTAVKLNVDAFNLTASFQKVISIAFIEDQKMKKQSNFKSEVKKFAKKISSEIIIATLLGTLPVTIYSVNAKSLDDTVGGLLAIGNLINYAGYLTVVFILATGLRYIFRFSSESAQRNLVAFHRITAELGTCFLTVIRTGLGAMIGILIIAFSTNVITLSPGEYISLTGSIFCVLLVSTSLAVGHELLSKTSKTQQADNPLKFDSNIKR